MKNILSFLIGLFCLASLQAQEKNIQDVAQLKSTYKDFFSLNRESVYLQLNKTKVLPNEDLWFSAYVFDTRLMKPNTKTTNLHVNLYNQQGHLMQTKTIYIQHGKGQGYFDLDTINYQPGFYVIKAFTNYMDNFKTDLSFRQGFEIMGSNKDPVARADQTHYDLQILPEGGHLLQNSINTIGVKLIDQNGLGCYFRAAKVLNSEGHTVTTFKANKFGMGKFTLNYKSGENYTLQLTPENGSPLSLKIPPASPRGISMSVNNLMPGNLFIALHTNPATLKQIGGQQFYIAIHQETAIEVVPFTFPKNRLKTNITIDKKVLTDGVNIITIFNKDYQPLLERQIFYKKNIKRARVHAQLYKNNGDSLILNLSSLLRQGKNSLSISVLPGETKAYSPQHNILSAFYIAPFIRGNLENGAYYFSDGQKRRKAYDLDLLLLTQGWSQYQWNQIFKGKPEIYHPHEHGFVISGRVNQANIGKKSQVMLQNELPKFIETVNIDQDHHFEINKLFVFDRSKIYYGMVNENNEVERAKIYIRLNPQKDTKDIEVKKSDFFGLKSRSNPTQASISLSDLYKTGKLLSTVFIESKPIQEPRKNEFSNFVTGNKIEIDEDMEKIFPYITDVIDSRGFDVHRTPTGVSISTRYGISLRGSGRPTIELDGVALTDFSQLLTLRTSDVKALYINKNGFGLGMKGAAGYIQIFTDMGLGGTAKKKGYVTTQTMELKNGFARPKKYYNPKYKVYYSDIFAHYGVIDWFPNISLHQGSGSQTIKVLNTGQASINLYIQGMTASGQLISEKLRLKTR